MLKRILISAALLTVMLPAAMPAAQSAETAVSELIRADFTTQLVPHPVPYAALLPAGYKDGPPLPLLFFLHGGGGDREALSRMLDIFNELWKTNRLPKMVVVTPTVAPRCFYMDYRDGTEKWETLLMGPFREFLQKTFNATTDPKKTFMMGASMGGLGTLRMGMKHPTRFGAIASLEPGIEPILHWKDMLPRNRFSREDSWFEASYGKPVDPAYWEANHPTSIVKSNPQRIIDSGLQIYLDVGNEDSLFLFEGVEFMHRVMWDSGILHEYHVVHGADHVGRTLRPRMTEALEFFTRVLTPAQPDPEADQWRKTLDPKKKKYGIP